MAIAQSKAPQIPAGASINAKAQADFQQMKAGLSAVLDGIDSWELVPSGYDKVMMKFTETGSEAQAKTFQAAITK